MDNGFGLEGPEHEVWMETRTGFRSLGESTFWAFPDQHKRIINGDETSIGAEGTSSGRAKTVVSKSLAVTGGSIKKTDGKAHNTGNLAMCFPEYEREALVGPDGQVLIPAVEAAAGEILPWQVRDSQTCEIATMIKGEFVVNRLLLAVRRKM